MEHARPLEAQTVPAEKSAALTSLRLQRKLTVEEAAKKAALWPEQVEWLEEGRLYRFPGYEAAVTALLRYATALGIDHREARRLSGMPVEPPPPRQLGRWIAAGAAAALVGAAVLALVLALTRGSTTAAERQAAGLAPPVEGRGRRAQRRRRHQLHAAHREPHRLLRIPDPTRDEGKPLRLQGNGRFLRARRGRTRPAPRNADRLWQDEPPSWRQQSAQARRDRGPSPRHLLTASALRTHARTPPRLRARPHAPGGAAGRSGVVGLACEGDGHLALRRRRGPPASGNRHRHPPLAHGPRGRARPGDRRRRAARLRGVRQRRPGRRRAAATPRSMPTSPAGAFASATRSKPARGSEPPAARAGARERTCTSSCAYTACP